MCRSCTGKVTFLRTPRRDAKNIRLSAAQTETGKSEREPETEKSGNFLQRDQSLVARRERSKRYTAKYRDGVVRKILDGHVTISEVRQDLNVSEQDILDWLAVFYADQDERIQNLTQIIRSLTGGEYESARIETDYSIPANVVDAPQSAGGA